MINTTELKSHNRKNRIKESTGYRVFTVCNTILMLLIAAATLYPFLYLVSQSFTSDKAIIAGHTSLIPEGFNVNTYKYILSKGEFLMYYKNTIVYTIVGTISSLLFSAFLAYPMSKNELKFNKFLTPFIVFTVYFGGGLIANYILVDRVGIKNTMAGFILPMMMWF